MSASKNQTVMIPMSKIQCVPDRKITAEASKKLQISMNSRIMPHHFQETFRRGLHSRKISTSLFVKREFGKYISDMNEGRSS